MRAAGHHIQPDLANASRRRRAVAAIAARRVRRPGLLALRGLITAAVSAESVAVAGISPASLTIMAAALAWLIWTGRHDIGSGGRGLPPDLGQAPVVTGGVMGGEGHHTFPAGPPPRGGNAPICWNTSIRFSSSQCSTNMPSSARQMSMERISTGLPLAGMPMSSPVWVPR
jgi:hypothetical protein